MATARRPTHAVPLTSPPPRPPRSTPPPNDGEQPDGETARRGEGAPRGVRRLPRGGHGGLCRRRARA
eukprot:32289-Chlamydomonas_euryale.AAC.1